MILAPVADAPRSFPLHPQFARAFAWLAHHPNPADGRHDIDGEDLFAIVESGYTRDAASARVESHRDYIDLQIPLAGGECMGWVPVAGLTIALPFEPGVDVQFYHEPALTTVLVQPGWFAAFFPEDGHLPLLHRGHGPAPFRKLVFKVRISPSGASAGSTARGSS